MAYGRDTQQNSPLPPTHATPPKGSKAYLLFEMTPAGAYVNMCNNVA